MTDEKEPSKEALEVARCIEVPYKGMADVNFALALDAHTDARIAAALLRENYPNMCRKLIAENERERAHERDPFGPPDIQQRFRTQLARADAADERASKRGVARLESELTAEKASHAATRAELESTKDELARDTAHAELADLKEDYEAQCSGHQETNARKCALEAELEATRKELALETKGRGEYREQIDVLIGERDRWRLHFGTASAKLESLRKPLEGELAEDVRLVHAALHYHCCSAADGHILNSLDRIEAALRAKGPIDEHLEHGCAETFVSLESRARAGERLAVHQTEWLAAEAARLRAKGEPQVADAVAHEVACYQAGWTAAMQRRDEEATGEPQAAEEAELFEAAFLEGYQAAQADAARRARRMYLFEMKARLVDPEPAAPAPELPRKVEPRTALTVGATYRVTEVADLNMAKLVAGDVLLCAENTPHALRPEWFGDYGAAYWIAWGARGKGCTYVTGLELVADAPKGKP